MNALANLYRKDKAALLLAASSSTTPRSVNNLLHKLCSMTDTGYEVLTLSEGSPALPDFVTTTCC